LEIGVAACRTAFFNLEKDAGWRQLRVFQQVAALEQASDIQTAEVEQVFRPSKR
jgi:hypothetical protein